MENRNLNNQQPNYQQQYQPYGQQPQQPYAQPQQYQQQQYAQARYVQTDPDYEAKASELLTGAITSVILPAFPVASIIAIFKGKANRKKVLEYLENGGLHTTKIKVCSALSRAGTYLGIGMTVVWAFFLVYITMMVIMMVLAMFGSAVYYFNM